MINKFKKLVKNVELSSTAIILLAMLFTLWAKKYIFSIGNVCTLNNMQTTCKTGWNIIYVQWKDEYWKNWIYWTMDCFT